MKYYFFRDLVHKANLMNGKTYHAYGIVDKIFNQSETPSGKDISVSHFSAFECCVVSEWRTHSEIELFEVNQWEWETLKHTLNKIEKYG